MEPDPILDEIHETRRQLAARFGNDMHAIWEWARRRQKELGHEVVSYPPRRPWDVGREQEELGTAERAQGDLLATLAQLRRNHPEWQLGRIVAEVTKAAGRSVPSDLGELEDAEALAAARELIRRASESGSHAA